MICCYNAARNDPYKESRHPRYAHLEKWPDSRVKEVGRRQWQQLEQEVRPEPALAPVIFGNRVFQRRAVEIRPIGRHEHQLAVGSLPEQEI